MKCIDLDDLPPRLAALLEGLSPGEDLALVRGGLVVGRLTATETPPPAVEADVDLPPEVRMREVFEDFRAAIEDEF